MRTPEGIEKDKVKVFLDDIGAYHFWPVQTGYGEATLDCLACIKGQFWAIEVKKQGFKKSDFTTRQLVNAGRVTDAGGGSVGGDAAYIIEFLGKWLASKLTV